MYEILQILSLSMFENTPINQLLANTPENSDADLESNQLNLTDPSVSEAFLRQVAGMK